MKSIKLAVVTDGLILMAPTNPFWVIAKAIKLSLPDHKVEVAVEGGQVYFVDDQIYPLPQAVLDWLARYAKWGIMEPLTFEVEYVELDQRTVAKD